MTKHSEEIVIGSGMEIAVLKNHPAEGPALIADWAKEKGIGMTIYKGHKGSFPDPSEYDALVVMGGPASVNDAEKDEAVAKAMETVKEFLEADKGLLGVCLGAQMLAVAAGGSVIEGPEKEIGWYPVSVASESSSDLLSDLPLETVVFHWHGEQIELPPRAELLASSLVCPVQAFQLAPHQIGFQCHLEVDSNAMDKMMAAFAKEVRIGGPGVMTAVEMTNGLHRWGVDCRQFLFRLLDRWSSEVSG